MATHNRRPLTNRPLQNPTTRSASLPKRPRSPDTHPDPFALRPSSKRVKAAGPSPVNASTRASAQATRPSTRDRKQAERSEREQQKAEFKEKYSRAFPTFTFCFDIDNVGPVDVLVSKIRQLGGV
jgi:regulatory subunit for Cdc7p protein kinase